MVATQISAVLMRDNQYQSFLDGTVGKESACNPGDTGNSGLIPGSGRQPGEGNGNPLQYSC